MIELGCRVGNVKRRSDDGKSGMEKVNKRLAGWGTCSVQGETENLVLPWKDAPSIRVGSQQHFTATDIQTGRK